MTQEPTNPPAALQDSLSLSTQPDLLLSKADAAKLRSITIEQLTQQCIADLVTLNHLSNDFSQHLDLLASQLGSAINIQHWLPADEVKWIGPPDPYYPQNYARWRDFLLIEAQSLLSVSTQLTTFELRSLLIGNGRKLLDELQYTAVMEASLDVYKWLCDMCLLPAAMVTILLQDLTGDGLTGPNSFLPSETGLGFILRDRGGAAEEDMGIISFECITNTRQPDHMIKLLTLKSIFSRQLPKMPREYITRLTFDRHHYSFCLLKKGRVIGGVCFRPFFNRKFAEIVFLAVTSTEQVKGYGTRLMNHLKEFVRHRNIEYFLTYADNFALGYFRKQGFSQRISMPRERWTGYIKDYDGGTLMECYVSPKIDYLNLGKIFVAQRCRVHQAVRLLKTLSIYSGAALWSSCEAKSDPMVKKEPGESTGAGHLKIAPHSIPGFIEAGWTEELNQPRKKDPLPLNDQIMKILDIMVRNENSWPFRKPVSRAEAPDYHEHIKHPMDISTMRKNARSKVYRTKQEFGAHLKLMFDNCRYYNMQSSIYYKLADELEAAIWPKYLAIEET